MCGGVVRLKTTILATENNNSKLLAGLFVGSQHPLIEFHWGFFGWDGVLRIF